MIVSSMTQEWVVRFLIITFALTLAASKTMFHFLSKSGDRWSLLNSADTSMALLAYKYAKSDFPSVRDRRPALRFSAVSVCFPIDG